MTWVRTGACVFGLIATAACGSDAHDHSGMDAAGGAGPIAGSFAPGAGSLPTGAPPVVGAGRAPGLASSAPSVRPVIPPPPPPSTMPVVPPVTPPVTPPANPTTPPAMVPGGAPGAPPAPAGPPAMAAPPGDPVIPEVAGECPEFTDGTITFMGLGGISMSAGSKPASPTAPMVFYWHGTGSFSGEYATMAAAVASGVAAEGGVLISFQGSTGGDLLSGTSVFGEGDFALTDQLVACAVKNHNVDPRRIFTTGCSAGGLFSAAMAAMRSNYVAAAAPNSGGTTVPVQFQGAYTPPLMTVHGAAGADVVIVDFSMTSASADMLFKQHGGFVINCDHGGGHCGGGGLAGDMWEFFKAHPYGTNPSPWKDALPSGFSGDCKIF
jgi:dienelactone hydrolase